MTNEEAIRIISNYEALPCGYCHQGGEEIEVAFRKAIEALETLKPKLLTLGEIINAKNSNDYIADAIRAFWKKDLPQDVVVFFYQKYEFEENWEWCAELAFPESDSDFETVNFLNDFCEGQTCVKNITIVPLSDVTEHYARTKLE